MTDKPQDQIERECPLREQRAKRAIAEEQKAFEREYWERTLYDGLAYLGFHKTQELHVVGHPQPTHINSRNIPLYVNLPSKENLNYSWAGFKREDFFGKFALIGDRMHDFSKAMKKGESDNDRREKLKPLSESLKFYDTLTDFISCGITGFKPESDLVLGHYILRRNLLDNPSEALLQCRELIEVYNRFRRDHSLFGGGE